MLKPDAKVKILKRARSIISQGWTKHKYARVSTSEKLHVCLLGAVRLASAEYAGVAIPDSARGKADLIMDRSERFYSVVGGAVTALRPHIQCVAVEAEIIKAGNICAAVRFNDHDKTKRKHVLEVLDRAIKAHEPAPKTVRKSRRRLPMHMRSKNAE